jgi:hypothetical protein
MSSAALSAVSTTSPLSKKNNLTFSKNKIEYFIHAR